MFAPLLTVTLTLSAPAPCPTRAVCEPLQVTVLLAATVPEALHCADAIFGAIVMKTNPAKHVDRSRRESIGRDGVAQKTQLRSLEYVPPKRLMRAIHEGAPVGRPAVELTPVIFMVLALLNHNNLTKHQLNFNVPGLD
jgi:hypothetical protein